MASLDPAGVCDFLAKSGAWHIATIDANGHPKNRPFGLLSMIDGHAVSGHDVCVNGGYRIRK
jgi:hypothetical protein